MNFEALKEAFGDGLVGLLECRDRQTGEPVAVVCAINDENDQVELVPFAVMVDDPYSRFCPPDEAELDEAADDKIQGLLKGE